jgi:hypothetical protein
MTEKISTNHDEVKAQYPKLYIRPVNEDENKPCWGKKSTESKSVKFGFRQKKPYKALHTASHAFAFTDTEVKMLMMAFLWYVLYITDELICSVPLSTPNLGFHTLCRHLTLYR